MMVLIVSASCSRDQDSRSTPEPSERSSETPPPEPVEEPRLEWALAIHGGAGVIARDDTDADGYLSALEEVLAEGRRALAKGTAALEVVEQLVRIMEDDERWNAGRGAVYTSRGTHELDAALMDGRTLACGAVAGVRNTRHPITLARRVMERSPHVLLSGAGADDFARQNGVEMVRQAFFHSPRRYQQLQEAKQRERSGTSSGGGGGAMATVGAVALDRYGNLAAGTSTGGMTNKRWGRVGDVPLIGAGTYANNESVAVSCTGRGEEFIRHNVAHEIAARVQHLDLDVDEAARQVVHEVLSENDGGVIAVDPRGRIALEFNSPGMFRGAADASGRFEVGIWETTRHVQEASTNR